MNLKELEDLANQAWEPLKNRILHFLKQPLAEIPPAPSRSKHWQCFIDGQWEILSPMLMDKCIVYDFEAKKDPSREIEFWYPTLCVAWDGRWWCWFPPDDAHHLTVEAPKDRVWIGQNSVSYDRRYLSSSYDLTDKSYHLDTIQLNTIIAGLSSGDTSPIRVLWNKFKGLKEKGNNVPNWFHKGCPGDLGSLVSHYLGYEWSKKIDKSIRDDYTEDPTKVTADTLFSYCATDVASTKELALVLFTKALLEFVPSPITWLGMGEVNRSRYYLHDWEKFITESDKKFEEARQQLRDKLPSLIKLAIAGGQAIYPDLDWKLLSRGDNKGQYRWMIDLKNNQSPFGSKIEALLLRLYWDGSPINLEKAGRQQFWKVDGVALPHPSGRECNNLGTPLCADYAVYAKNGRLTSAVMSQKELIEIFNLLSSTSQWEAYRDRYLKLYYSQDPRTGQNLCVADLNGTGTVSRRATSSIWVVLPKPKDNKIGSHVMRHIGSPDGYKLVSADFVSQESRIAAAQMVDCRIGAHGSTPWSESILSGEKSKSTDAHSLTAATCGISRDAGKTVNFCTLYGGGLAQTAATIRLAKGCDQDEAEAIAAKFLDWLKGAEGVAKEAFASLKLLSSMRDIRTYLLRVKVPDTLNCFYLPSKNEFSTTRNNWHIQSAGQDELHVLIILVKILAAQQGIGCIFACSVHDRAAFFFPDDYAQQAKAILNQAYGLLMRMAYAQAAEHWNSVAPLLFGKTRNVLEPLPNWLTFEKVYVSDVLMEE